MAELPRAAVIGAGSSGIAAIKALHQRGFDVTAFDKSDRVDGNRVYQNTNAMPVLPPAGRGSRFRREGVAA
jgi:cation diffusion facilitator CzcD-associated flavoprotein CzcO